MTTPSLVVVGLALALVGFIAGSNVLLFLGLVVAVIGLVL